MIRTLTMTIVALLGICSCTQNNGYIGAIFGSWSLIEISEDGIPLEMEYETIFSFQNQVVQVTKRENPPMASVYRYGNFEKTDNILILKFQTTPTASGNLGYTIPNWLYFPLDVSPIVMDIKDLNGGKMVLELATEDKVLEYTFARTW